MKIIQKAIDKISNLLSRPKTYMNFLDEKEFNELLYLMSNWYRYHKPFSSTIKAKKNNKAFNSLLKKIRDKTLVKLPSKLYRGLHWTSKREYDSFIKNLENGKIKVTEENGYSSWSTSKKVAKSFLPSGTYGKRFGSKYGVLLEINPKDFKEDIVFSTSPLFKNQQEINIFLRLIIDRHYSDNKKALALKKPDIGAMHNSIDYLEGSLYSTEEKEFILKTPTRNIGEIKYTIEEK